MEYHRFLEPAKELAQSISERAFNTIARWAVPPESVEFVQQKAVERTVEVFTYRESSEE